MDYSKYVFSRAASMQQSQIRGRRGKKGLIGIDTVNDNLNRALKDIKNKSLLGMVEASILIRTDMDDTSPKVPIDLGNLNASWFTTSNMGGGSDKGFKGKKAAEMAIERSAIIVEMKAVVKAQKEPTLIMGFSANYAAPVHEMVGVNFKRPGSGAKFFQSALARNTKQIIRIMKDSVEIP